MHYYLQVTDQVKDRKSLIASVIYAVFPRRMEIYDYTYAFEFAFLGFSMEKPGLSPQWYSLYYPFSIEVWGAIILALVIIVFPVKIVSITIKSLQFGIKNFSW